MAASFANAQDAQLRRVREALLPLRQLKGGSSETRGASPAFDGIKHYLRDFVESRLRGLSRQGNPLELADQINQQLRDAGLFCGAVECPEQSLLGFLDKVELQF